MSKGMRNLARLTHAAAKAATVQPGETCVLCGAPATHTVGDLVSTWRPACEKHAREAKRRGYDVMPEISVDGEPAEEGSKQHD